MPKHRQYRACCSQLTEPTRRRICYIVALDALLGQELPVAASTHVFKVAAAGKAGPLDSLVLNATEL